MSWLAVGAGAAIGAWLRWGFATWLGSMHAHVQAGTLAANLAGGTRTTSVGTAVTFALAPAHHDRWQAVAVHTA